MKACPVCHAIAFDDAIVCYGCLHRFDDADAAALEAASIPPEPPSASSAPSFTVRFTPVHEPSGALTWNCTVESV